MRRILFMCLDAGFSAVIMAPLFLWLNKRYFHDLKRTVWYFFMAVYLSGMYAVVGLPDIRYMRLDLHFNFIPFAYMFSDYTNSLLNVLLFIPLGFFLPVLWITFKRFLWTVFFGLSMSVLIEGLQIFTLRATDINDLMTNTFGAIVGWCLGILSLRLRPGLKPQEQTHEVFAVCAVSFGTMFFLQPFLADAVLYLFL